MRVQASDLYLYHLTLQNQSNYIHSIQGYFVDLEEEEEPSITSKVPKKAPKQLQLCLATENTLELYDVSEGKLNKIQDFVLFGKVTSLETFRIENVRRNYLVLTSDSGNLTILNIVRKGPKKCKLNVLVNEPISRSGIRRLSPISYCKVDSKSRCIMLSAVEKFKCVYTLNTTRDNTSGINGSITVSSPIEATRSNFITLQLVACPGTYVDNPHFASIELEMQQYGSPSTHQPCHLIFYMLDLNLNHLVKRADYLIDTTASFLLELPDLRKYGVLTDLNGAGDDNGMELTNPFVLIGCQNHILIRDLNGYYNLKVNIPKRLQGKEAHNDGNDKLTIISGTVQAMKKDFFVLLQSNKGDIFKLRIRPNADDRNRPIVSLVYFDSICRAEKLHIFKSGYLFVNSEYNDNYLLQFDSLGTEEFVIENSFEYQKTGRSPFHELKNLSLVDIHRNLNPMLTAAIDTNQPFPLLITASQDSHIRSYSNTVEFVELIKSPLPPNPQNIWALKADPTSKYHTLLVLAFQSSTLFLKIDNDAIQDLPLPKENPFISKGDKTIYVATMAQNTVIQVCQNQFVLVSLPGAKHSGKTNEGYTQSLVWFPPAGIRIVSAASSWRQLAVGLSNNNIVYFEMTTDGKLLEFTKRATMNSQILHIALCETVDRSPFLIVATEDHLLSAISLRQASQIREGDNSREGSDILDVASFAKLIAPASDIVYVTGCVHVGLSNGVYVRLRIADHTVRSSGEFSDIWNRYIGAKKVRLSCIARTYLEALSDAGEEEEEEGESENDDDDINEKRERELAPSIIVHSDTTWVSYEYDGFFYVRPLSFPTGIKNIAYASEFTTKEIIYNGFCALSGSGELLIGKFANFPNINRWFRMEEFRLIGSHEDERDNEEGASQGEDYNSDEDENNGQEFVIPRYRCKEILSFAQYTLFITNSILPENPPGCRVSIKKSSRAINSFLKTRGGSEATDPYQMSLVSSICLSATLVNFSNRKTEHPNLVLATKDGKLLTYKIDIDDASFSLHLLHETFVGSCISAMCQFANMLLAPSHGNLILYSLGKTQLLRKSITKLLPSISKVTSIASFKDEKIAVGDVYESVTIYSFDRELNQFKPIADDITKRHVTRVEFLDEWTVIGADKFGSIWTLRLPENVKINHTGTSEIKRNKMGYAPNGNISERPYKLQLKNHFYINDIVTKFFVLDNPNMSDREAIIYVGLQGTVGALIPILSKNEVKLLSKLQKGMREIEMLLPSSEKSNDTYMDEGVGEDIEGIEDANENVHGDDTFANKDMSKGNRDRFPEVIGSYTIVGREHAAYRGYYAPVRNVIDGNFCEQFLSYSKSEQTAICRQISGGSPIQSEAVVKLLNEVRTSRI